MKDKDYHDLNTLILHGANDRDPFTGAVSTPIYQVSTFHRDPANPSKYDYSRSANPTRDILQNYISKIEGGCAGFAFSSGMAAINAALMLFSPGDHLIVSKDIYGGTYRILTQVFSQWNLQIDFIDITNLTAIKAKIKPNTRGIFFEVLSNPFQTVADLKGIIQICQEYKLLSVIDNTFLPPYYCRPLDYGADIVLHSATKFLNGHSDVIAGTAAVNDPDLARRLGFLHNALGSILGPQDSWLLIRGIKTLGIRLERQAQNAQSVAPWLASQSWVKQVWYPGLLNHPRRELLADISTGYGSIITFEVQDETQKRLLMEKLTLPAVAVSLGGVESILSHPATMSHAGMPAKIREEQGINDRVFRLSVGLEHPQDLIDDLTNTVLY